MTNFADISGQALSGKHNMAADAFQALRSARADGKADPHKVNFADIIDTVNPLQHIPVVGTLYREMTGDDMSSQARMAGGAIYGGPVGFVVSMIDSAIDLATGNDVGGHIYSSLFGSDDKPTMLATADNAQLITASLAPQASPAPGALALPTKPAAEPLVQPKAQAAAQTPPSPMPQLSPEAFNALLGSFADPEAARTANADIAAALESTAPEIAAAPQLAINRVADGQGAPVSLPVNPAPQRTTRTAPSNLFQNMQSGLSQLEALKAANAKNLSLSAAGANSLSGF
jgi:hypothetical protein